MYCQSFFSPRKAVDRDKLKCSQNAIFLQQKSSKTSGIKQNKTSLFLFLSRILIFEFKALTIISSVAHSSSHPNFQNSLLPIKRKRQKHFKISECKPLSYYQVSRCSVSQQYLMCSQRRGRAYLSSPITPHDEYKAEMGISFPVH